MPASKALFEILLRTPSAAVDHALAAAMEGADPATLPMIIDALLARGSDIGLKGLVASWHRLDAPLRERALAHSGKIFSVLRESMATGAEQVRLNVVRIIGAGGLCRAGYLLDPAFHDRAPQVRDAAAEAVHAMAERLMRSAPCPDGELTADSDPDKIRAFMDVLESHHEDRRQLGAAIEAGLGCYDLHQKPAVVEAAMWMIDDLGPRLWKVLSAPGSRLVRAAQALLARGADARLVPFMMAALNYAEFRPTVVNLLANCTDLAFLTEWFQQSWRSAQPRVARSLPAVRDLACARNRLSEVLNLPEAVQRHFARCLPHVGLADSVKLEVLRELQRRGIPAVARASVWSLTGLGEERVASILRTIAAQKDSPGAWIARCELTRRRPAEYPIGELGRCAQSNFGPPAAATPEAELTFDGYWLAFDRLMEEDRLRLGRELMSRGRLAEALINRRLSSVDAADRIRALRMVVLLGLTASFETQIYRLSHDPNPEVRSAAVTALGLLPTGASRRLLRGALYDGDARVQANAVEAFEQMGDASAAPELIPKLASSDNRIRANAVKALLKLGVREAAETLLLMLMDENRAHRASAVWLIDQMKLFAVAGRVVEMAESDSDEQIRTRARALAGRMIAGRASLEVAQREPALTEAIA